MDPAYAERIAACLEAVERFRKRWRDFAPDETLHVNDERISTVWAEFCRRLDENYPFFHPDYAGQMLKPPHPVAVLAYFTAAHVNPNNHALDGGPATARMEKEAVAAIAGMLGWEAHLGHLTGGGTIANLEALWVARELRPGTAVAASSDAHYTHRRMCRVLGVPFIEIPADSRGRLDTGALRRCIARDRIGTVVGTLGTTGLGALDPIDELAEIADAHGLRLHVDAAYGGFYRLLAGDPHDGVSAPPFEALTRADSVVIDPHKHGLQPYGCGCVLFRDPSVGRFYRHDSPYTYFTSDELHLGEISLECSRAGAAAAALWFTLQCLPLERDAGLGPILRKCRRAALGFARSIAASARFVLLLEPETDIVVFAPRVAPFTSSNVSRASNDVFARAMTAVDTPVFLSKLRLPSERVATLWSELETDAREVVMLRSCLMKPEHDAHVGDLMASLERVAQAPVRRPG